MEKHVGMDRKLFRQEAKTCCGLGQNTSKRSRVSPYPRRLVMLGKETGNDQTA